MDGTDYENKELAWDLRQIYARLVGVHLVDCSDARNEGNFYKWFKALENIKTIVKHKFKKKTEAVKEYDKLVGIVKDLANKNKTTWEGMNKNAREVFLIDKALRDLEEFLWDEMEKGGVFGEKYQTRGL
jgi:hypothetical protein